MTRVVWTLAFAVWLCIAVVGTALGLGWLGQRLGAGCPCPASPKLRHPNPLPDAGAPHGP